MWEKNKGIKRKKFFRIVYMTAFLLLSNMTAGLYLKEQPISELPKTAGFEETENTVVQLSVIPVTVEQGDSLWKIATEYYEDGKKWTVIYEWNRSVIGDDPSLIYEGTELSLPWMRDWLWD